MRPIAPKPTPPNLKLEELTLRTARTWPNCPELKVWSVDLKVWSIDLKVWSIDLKVWSVGLKVRSVDLKILLGYLFESGPDRYR